MIEFTSFRESGDEFSSSRSLSWAIEYITTELLKGNYRIVSLGPDRVEIRSLLPFGVKDTSIFKGSSNETEYLTRLIVANHLVFEFLRFSSNDAMVSEANDRYFEGRMSDRLIGNHVYLASDRESKRKVIVLGCANIEPTTELMTKSLNDLIAAVDLYINDGIRLEESLELGVAPLHYQMEAVSAAPA